MTTSMKMVDFEGSGGRSLFIFGPETGSSAREVAVEGKKALERCLERIFDRKMVRFPVPLSIPEGVLDVFEEVLCEERFTT